MAIQRADQEHDRPRRRWWNRHGPTHSNSHDGSVDGSPGGSDGAGADELPVEADGAPAGAPHVTPDGAPHGGSNFATDVPSHWRPLGRIGDLRERWISSKALELEFYPEFLEASGWAPLPWLAVSKSLKRVTKKRTKQLMLFKNGKRQRCCVVQFKIPR